MPRTGLSSAIAQEGPVHPLPCHCRSIDGPAARPASSAVSSNRPGAVMEWCIISSLRSDLSQFGDIPATQHQLPVLNATGVDGRCRGIENAGAVRLERRYVFGISHALSGSRKIVQRLA